MPTSYAKALHLLSLKEKKKLESAIKLWSTDYFGSTVIRNLESERFLGHFFMKELLSEILTHSTGPREKIGEAYQTKCYKHQRKGGYIRTIPKPKTIGNAIDKSTFINGLVRNHPIIFPSRIYAEDFVRRLISGGKLLNFEREIITNRHTVWATWSDNLESSDPFDFVVSESATEIRASLGLDPKTRRLPLLLIAYNTTKLGLFRPTVADAGLHRQFRPPEKQCKAHGRTIPWEKGHLPSSLVKISLIPRPEAVHRPIPLGNVLTQIREVTP